MLAFEALRLKNDQLELNVIALVKDPCEKKMTVFIDSLQIWNEAFQVLVSNTDEQLHGLVLEMKELFDRFGAVIAARDWMILSDLILFELSPFITKIGQALGV
jgi:hypothetical protein